MPDARRSRLCAGVGLALLGLGIATALGLPWVATYSGLGPTLARVVGAVGVSAIGSALLYVSAPSEQSRMTTLVPGIGRWDEG